MAWKGIAIKLAISEITKRLKAWWERRKKRA